jgi:hypothetical protein
MGEIHHASEWDEPYGELRKFVEKLFREHDLVEEGVIIGVHQTDRSISKYVGRTAHYEGDKNPAEFESLLRKCESEDMTMISIRGQRHDYRIYFRAKSVTEAYGKLSVWHVMTSWLYDLTNYVDLARVRELRLAVERMHTAILAPARLHGWRIDPG